MTFRYIVVVFRNLPEKIRRKWAAIVFLGILSAFLEMAISILFGVLLSGALNPNLENRTEPLEIFNQNLKLNEMLVVFIGFIVIRVGISILEANLKASTTSKSILEYSNKYVSQILDSPGNSKFSSSQLQVSVIDNANQTFRWSFLSLVNIISSGLIIGLLGTLMILVEPKYGSFILVSFALILLPLIGFLMKGQVRLSEDLQESSNNLYNVVRHTIELKREIILYKRKSDFQQYFQDKRKHKTKLESTLISKSIIPRIVIETSFFLMTAIFVGITLNFDSTLTVDQNFLTFVFIIFRLMPLFSQISSQYSQFRLGVPSIRELGGLAASLPIAEKDNKE